MASAALRSSSFYAFDSKVSFGVSHGGAPLSKHRGMLSACDMKVVAMVEKKRRRRGPLQPTEGRPLDESERQFKHRVTMSVGSPLDHVWSLWIDLESAPKWMRWITRVDILDEGTSPNTQFSTETADANSLISHIASHEGENSKFLRETEISSIATPSILGRIGGGSESAIGSTGSETPIESSVHMCETEGSLRTDDGESLSGGRSEGQENNVFVEAKGQRSSVKSEKLDMDSTGGGQEKDEFEAAKEGGSSVKSGFSEREDSEGLSAVVPRLNSLSRWICCTAGFEVAWVARIESVEISKEERVLRWTSVQGFSSHGEVRFSEGKSHHGTDIYLTAIHRLPPALSKVMNRHALSTLVQATLKSDLERFREYVLTMQKSASN